MDAEERDGLALILQLQAVNIHTQFDIIKYRIVQKKRRICRGGHY